MLTKAFNQLTLAFLDDFARAFPDEKSILLALKMAKAIIKCNESSPLLLLSFTNGETENLQRLDRTLFEIPRMRMDQLTKQLTPTNRAALDAHMTKLAELADKHEGQIREINEKISEARQSDAYATIEDMIKNPQNLLSAASNPEKLASIGEVFQQNKALQGFANDIQSQFKNSDDAQQMLQQAQTTVEGLLGKFPGLTEPGGLVNFGEPGNLGGAPIDNLTNLVSNLDISKLGDLGNKIGDLGNLTDIAGNLASNLDLSQLGDLAGNLLTDSSTPSSPVSATSLPPPPTPSQKNKRKRKVRRAPH